MRKRLTEVVNNINQKSFQSMFFCKGKKLFSSITQQKAMNDTAAFRKRSKADWIRFLASIFTFIPKWFYSGHEIFASSLFQTFSFSQHLKSRLKRAKKQFAIFCDFHHSIFSELCDDELDSGSKFALSCPVKVTIILFLGLFAAKTCRYPSGKNEHYLTFYLYLIFHQKTWVYKLL